jgi:2-oxoglutarate ferredoxin oxidoreductase subunit gamma
MDKRYHDKRIPSRENKMTHRIIIAGAGGQGIMMLGKVLAEAAMLEGRFVTYLPAYGAEVRGGTANCMVVVSDSQIGSPLVEEADSLIIMNEPSLARFANTISKTGAIFINSSLVKAGASKGRPVSLAFTDTAIRLGNQKAANMVALGSFCEKTKVIDIKSVRKIIENAASADRKDTAKLNIKALEAGSLLVRQERHE